MPWQLKMTLYSFLLVLLPYIYIGWRLSRTLLILWPGGGRPVYWTVPLLFLLLNLWPLVILGVNFSNQTDSLFLFKTGLTVWDYLLVYPFWLGLIIIVELLPYFLSLDIVQIVISIIGGNKKEFWIKVLAQGRLAVLAVMIFYVLVRSYQDTNTVRSNKFEISLNKKLPGLQNLNLVLIGDVQVDRYTGAEKLNQMQRHIETSRPDILFFAGDLVTQGRNYVRQGLEAMCATRAGLERIACMGDHDLWSAPALISQGLQNCGWKFVQNGHYLIQQTGCKILVTVITHVYSQRINRAQMLKLFHDKPQADLSILLVHQPADEIIRSAAENGYDIFLAGHTHGGQVVFNLFGFDLTPSRFENPHYSGYKKVGNMNIFVTNGIGLTMEPLRYRASAEVMEIRVMSETWP